MKKVFLFNKIYLKIFKIDTTKWELDTNTTLSNKELLYSKIDAFKVMLH